MRRIKIHVCTLSYVDSVYAVLFHVHLSLLNIVALCFYSGFVHGQKISAWHLAYDVVQQLALWPGILQI